MNNSTSSYSPRLLWRVSWGYLRNHFWQTGLMIMGIMLAVAVVISVDMANESARQAFDLSTTAITGKATHYLSGGSEGIEESVYAEIRLAGFDVPTAPVVTAYVTAYDLGDATYQLLGVDPFAESPFRDYLNIDGGIPIGQLTTFLIRPNSVLVAEQIALRYGLSPGSEVAIEYSGQNHTLYVAGLLQTSDPLSQRALNELLVMDISTAQELTGKLGLLDRVDLILSNADTEHVREIKQLLPNDVVLQPVETRTGVIEEMTAAFQVNLTALSLLAMVMALFLIYNSMTFSVTQRRGLFGTLRSLGVTRREVFLMVLLEALGVGVIGALLGTGLGILMGRGTVGLVTQTINDLFYVTTVRDIPVPIISLFKGNILGVIATVITASFPAYEAVTIPPRTALRRSELESKVRTVIPWVGAVGLLLILVGSGTILIPSRNLTLSFFSTFTIIIGLAMLTPLTTIWLMKIAGQATSRLWGVLGRMAPREVVNTLSRTSVAIAALMIAVAVTIGVSLMISSFRLTVVTWLDQILQGDVYISVPGATTSQPSYQLDPQVLPILEGFEGVQRVDLLQTAIVDSPNGPIQLSASNNPNDAREQLYLSTSHPIEEMAMALQQGEILISEPLANRLGVSNESVTLELFTDRGLQTFPIAGIFYDYSSTQGLAILPMDVYQQYWDDRAITAAALILKPGIDPDTISQDIQSRLTPIQRLQVRPNQAIRAETLVVFDRTFAITSALQVMTTVVAFVGILSAMMSLQLDKQRQFGILRAIGLTGKQLWRLVLLETGLIGTVAGLLAMPTGYILSLILIYIINRRSFGWTLQLQLNPDPFLQALIIAVGASLLAGLYPAWRILQRRTSEAIRFE